MPPVDYKQICGAAAAAPVTDADPIVIDLQHLKINVGTALSTNTIRNPPTADVTWQLWFHANRWAQNYGRKAYETGNKVALSKIVGQVASYYKYNPDTGAPKWGWDEGSSLRRLETLNCLYAMSKDSRIPALMAQEVRVQQGSRYYGPPYAMVHNHGTMANIRMMVAGQLTNNSSWTGYAANRLLAESPKVFSSKGVSYEQSSTYHNMNAVIWLSALDTLKSIYGENNTNVKNLASRLTAANMVNAWLTEPDGNFVMIGDAMKARGGSPRNPSANGGYFNDASTGFAIGRWSWNDKNTTYYTYRYGPRRVAHGHDDKNSVTWTTGGQRILIGPGYGNPSLRYPWWKTPAAHNASYPLGCTTQTTSSLKSHSQSSTSASLVGTDSPCGKSHTRQVYVNHPGKAIRVTDMYLRGVAHAQSWHLAPEWKLVSKSSTVLTFKHSTTGKRLKATAAGGTFTSVYTGTSRTHGGWSYESQTYRVPNLDITMTSRMRTASTTFALY